MSHFFMVSQPRGGSSLSYGGGMLKKIPHSQWYTCFCPAKEKHKNERREKRRERERERERENEMSEEKKT